VRRFRYVVLACVLSAFAGMALVASLSLALSKKQSPYHKLNLFTRVLSYVENNYVENVDQDELIYGALRGMLETLDPHTAFLKPDQYREMKVDTQGQFGGVGIEVEMRQLPPAPDEPTGGGRARDNVLTIMSVIENTPASRAGLQTGDQIIKIESTSTRTMRMDDAITKMRGKKGTQVTLTIDRPGPAQNNGARPWKEPRVITLERTLIHIDNVVGKSLEPGLGYVRVKQFSDGTEHDLTVALEKMEHEAPGGQLRALILDLRNNPGGLLDQAVRVADLFIESGLIVRTEGKGGRIIEEEHAHQRGTRSGFPMIVLVNGGSASASEIVAGALQDHGRAVVVGTQTFGKGSVQTVIELDDGSALKLTIARYFTPSGRSIQEKGITPDVVVDQVKIADLHPSQEGEPQQKERDLQGHLRNPDELRAATSDSKPEPATKPESGAGTTKPEAKADAKPSSPYAAIGDDFQLRTAYDYLKAWRIFNQPARPLAPTSTQ
jgi:carboxyl-terminal processing protease